MYLSFYGLKEEPFRLTPDPRFLHLAETHRTVLTSLMEGVLLRKGIVVATGPVGAGKTTLLHAMLHLISSPSTTKTPAASAFLMNPTMSREELLEAILDEFQISCPSTSKPRRLAALHQMLLETQRHGGTAVLIIDEAHLLTVELLEEIRLLSNTDSYREKLLQIIICGQPELLTLLARPELRPLQQRVAVRSYLRALSVSETRAYVAERLHAAGLRGLSPFSSAALQEIHRSTQGVPRLINLLCDACLTIGLQMQRKEIGPDIVEESATTLGLEAMPAAEPSRITPAEFPLETRTPRSPADLLIEAMKQGRAIARE